MPGLTRRGFLAGSVTTAAGAAGIGALAAVPLMGSNLSPSLTGAAIGAPTVAVPLVAFVRDGSQGELTVMAGTREVAIHDPELVRRLHAAAGGAAS